MKRPPISRGSGDVLVKYSRQLVLAALLFMYGGAVPYLVSYGQSLLYGYYLIILGTSAICWLRDAHCHKAFCNVVPYCLWYVVFSTWTVLVSTGLVPVEEAISMVFRDGVRMFIVAVAVSAAMPTRKHVTFFSNWLVIPVLGNAVISALSPYYPHLFAFTLRTDDIAWAERYTQIARIAGLWGNANQAAHAFVFAILISFWAHPVLAWTIRCSSLLGLFMTASRQGIYVLVLLGLFYAGHKLFVASGRKKGLSYFRLGIVFVLGIFVAHEAYNRVFKESVAAENFRRVLDFAGGRAERSGVAAMAWDKILEKPLIGHGAYAMRRYLVQYGPAEKDRGCHNIYLAVWGEGGVFLLLAYLWILARGLIASRDVRLPADDRLVLAMMWVTYLLVGLTWHGQLGNLGGLLYLFLLVILPYALSTRRATQLVPESPRNIKRQQ